MAVRADAVAPASTPTPATGLVGDDGGDTFRDRRRSRLAEGRRRRELLSAADPSVDPQFIDAIAAADRFWGPDEQWRDALRSQRSAASTASAEPSAGTVDAAEVSPAHPALVTIARLRGSLRAALARVRGSHRVTPQPVAAHSGAVDEEPPFDVPLPGQELRAVGRTRSWITRLALIGAPLVLIGGVAYSCGVSSGSARLVEPATISAADASAFHLSTFPADRAAAFGVSYLSLCWTHPDAADTTATADRLAALARMTSAGVTPGCGWTGSIPSKAPLAVTWDGTVKPVQGVYADGAAAQLGFLVTMADGRTVGDGFGDRRVVDPQRAGAFSAGVGGLRPGAAESRPRWGRIHLGPGRDGGAGHRTGRQPHPGCCDPRRPEGLPGRGPDHRGGRRGLDHPSRRGPARRLFDLLADDRRPLAGHRHHRCSTGSRRGSSTGNDLRHQPGCVTCRGITRKNRKGNLVMTIITTASTALTARASVSYTP